jgi:hypothetical protein
LLSVRNLIEIPFPKSDTLEDLREWGKKEGVDRETLSIFVKEEMWVDMLGDVADESLEDMGVESPEMRSLSPSSCLR